MKRLLKLIILNLTVLLFINPIKPVYGEIITPENDVPIKINFGSGNFFIAGGKGHENHLLKVFYHRPENFNNTSEVLIVIPGAGRNADDYRDSWIAAAEQYNLLILSPSYRKKDYDFANYHLGGMITNFEFVKKPRKDKYNQRYVLKIDDADISFDINTDSETLIYHDFDRLFDIVKKVLGAKQASYDIFGHSAGGQIAHRSVIFNPKSKVRRILASNSGFYTLPDFNTTIPFGLKNSTLSDEDLKIAFNKKLTLFIGELDNENETGGTLLHSPMVNQQGLHRLARSHYFYKVAKQQAKALNTELNWQLKIIPDIGHNYRLMGKEAAKFLYEFE